MDLDLEAFVQTLNSMGIQGIKRKYWLKIFYKNPDKAAGMFFEKLNREYQGQRQWEIAKYLLLKKYPQWGKPEPEPRSTEGGRRSCVATPEPEPEPKPEITPEPIFCKNVERSSVPHHRCELAPQYNLEYFLRINGGRWGDASYDMDEYERSNGVII